MSRTTINSGNFINWIRQLHLPIHQHLPTGRQFLMPQLNLQSQDSKEIFDPMTNPDVFFCFFLFFYDAAFHKGIPAEWTWAHGRRTIRNKNTKKKVKLCQMVDQVGWLVIIMAGIEVGSDPSRQLCGRSFSTHTQLLRRKHQFIPLPFYNAPPPSVAIKKIKIKINSKKKKKPTSRLENIISSTDQRNVKHDKRDSCNVSTKILYFKKKFSIF